MVHRDRLLVEALLARDGSHCPFVRGSPGFLGELQDEPSPTIPGIIQTLQRNPQLVCASSGRRVDVAPTELREDDFPTFWEFVADPGRTVPVVYVSPGLSSEGGTNVAVDPSALALALGPSAVVFYPLDRKFRSRMRARIGRMAKERADERVREAEDDLLANALTLERDLDGACAERDGAKAEPHVLVIKCEALEQGLASRG